MNTALPLLRATLLGVAITVLALNAAAFAATAAPEQAAVAAPLGSPTPTPAAAPTEGLNAASVLPAPVEQLNDFQGDEVSKVLRLLARLGKMNLVVSDKVQGTITMRVENLTPMQTIKVVVASKGLVLDEVGGVYYVKTAEERAKEPTVSGQFTFSYAKAENVADLLKGALLSKVDPQVDARTNTIYYREVTSNAAAIKLFCESTDCPTAQVMIEARLVEVTANPKQSYGINWGGVFGSSDKGQTFKYGGSGASVANGLTTVDAGNTGLKGNTGTTLGDLMYNGGGKNVGTALAGQFSILSVPQMSATLRLLNEDSDAEFLANPRVVTNSNEKATIKVVRSQPVPQLNFNEQTATAVFSGFQDKSYGNTLVVTPSVNKDGFISLSVQPEISSKVGDASFTFAGSTVTSPIIDTRSLDSKVLIKNGYTLAIGGLLQDENIKARTKVPVLGDIPLLGYAFQERMNSKAKRNLLIFITPTIIQPGGGTGLEDQVNGLKNSGNEYADPNGWRNNAKGAIRLLPKSNRPAAAQYPMSVNPAPEPTPIPKGQSKGKATPAPTPRARTAGH